MRVLNLGGNTGKCEILLGESLKNLKNYVEIKKTVIITDKTVRGLYGKHFSEFIVIEVEPGENSKTLENAERIYEQLLELEVDRSYMIVGVGGGVICDLSGFIASTYMRGLEFGFAPTTILAQTDASIGGKNGVNLKKYKNIIGTFNQPRFVLCDFDVLKTLPKKEMECGFAEIIKHAAIGDKELFLYLEENMENALKLHRTAIEKIIHESILVKTKVVESDEKEQGERRKLNFGHTFGHAIEKATGMEHGHAISIGMVVAANLSFVKGMLPKEEVDRLVRLLEKFNLPTRIESDKKVILDAIRKDKKREGEVINFVLLEKIGTSKIVPIKIEELEGVMNDLC